MPARAHKSGQDETVQPPKKNGPLCSAGWGSGKGQYLPLRLDSNLKWEGLLGECRHRVSILRKVGHPEASHQFRVFGGDLKMGENKKTKVKSARVSSGSNGI